MKSIANFPAFLAFLLTLVWGIHAANAQPAPSQPTSTALPAPPQPTSSAAAAAGSSTAPAAPAAAPASPVVVPPICVTTFLKAKPGKVTLANIELEAICDPVNQGALEAQVTATCPAVANEFITARAGVCATYPQIAGGPALDTVARVYRASNPALPKLPRVGAPPPAPSPNPAPATAAAPGPETVSEQGLTGTAIAEGIGGFLASRAEQEVSAFATVELFSRLCKGDLKGVLPKTCELLASQDNGASPVGLGLLRRTVEADLEHLPEHLLVTALTRVRAELADNPDAAQKKLLDHAATSLCVVDVGVAIIQALATDRKLGEFFTKERSDGLEKLKEYAALDAEPECVPLWNEIQSTQQRVNDTIAAARALQGAITELETAKTPGKQRQARVAVMEKAATLAKAIIPLQGEAKADYDALIDELGALGVGIWNRDWVDVVAAAASADHLGPLLLCQDPETGCKRDEKIRLLLSLAADIGSAESSADVQAALNRVVEPVGSWRRKFQDCFTFTFQGYAGAKVAYESVKGAPSSAVLAPVLALGFEASWKYSGTGRLAVFGQAIDVGNFASIRLAGGDDPNLTTVEATPDIAVAQLFAPGGYLIWTPAKMPFVLGLGADWVPALRKTPDGAKSALHVGGFLAVDVPILELVHE